MVLVCTLSDQKVKLCGAVHCPGGMPRDAHFSPCGKWLLIAEQAGHRLTSHRLIDFIPSQEASGSLETGSPVCLCFAGVNP